MIYDICVFVLVWICVNIGRSFFFILLLFCGSVVYDVLVFFYQLQALVIIQMYIVLNIRISPLQDLKCIDYAGMRRMFVLSFIVCAQLFFAHVVDQQSLLLQYKYKRTHSLN